MEIPGGAGVGVMVGFLVMVGVKDGVNVWSSVGDGVMVTGIFNMRVTSDVSTRVTSLVTSTFCITGTDIGLAANGAQATPANTNRNADKQGTRNFKRFAPFR
jgi:preprotein translocase subunit SecG